MTTDVDTEEQRWKPRRKAGGVYCSPACGSNCRRVDYTAAVRDSGGLAKRMGAGWEMRVWENMGWHWEIQKGVAHIRQHGRIYRVEIHTVVQVFANAETPEDALGRALRDARDLERRITSDCAVLL